MKKLFAFLMAVSMLITLSVPAIAEENETVFSASASADYETSNGLGTYNSNGSIDITVSLDEVSIPETVMGISVFMFKIGYDKDMVAPAVSGGIDSDGESFDYTSLMTKLPDGWECFGKVDSENGIFDLAIWDPTSINPIVESDALEIVVPFTVKPNAKGDDIVFTFNDCEIVEPNLEENALVEIGEITIEYALYPDVISELPEDALSLEIGGFQDGSNVVYYAQNDMTVSEYIYTYNQEDTEFDMSNYGILIADSKTGRITYFDISDNAKSDVVIPAGHYFIGVCKDNTNDFDKLVGIVAIDAVVTIYNINPEAVAKLTENVALTDAGCVIVDPKPILKEDSPANYDFENALIRVGATKLRINDFKALFENDITVLDENGKVVKSGYVKTGMTIDYADGVTIIMIGDVYADGKIDSFDYLYVRRHCFKTLELEGAMFLAADIDNSGDLNSFDYLLVKRIFFKTIDISALVK